LIIIITDIINIIVSSRIIIIVINYKNYNNNILSMPNNLELS